MMNNVVAKICSHFNLSADNRDAIKEIVLKHNPILLSVYDDIELVNQVMNEKRVWSHKREAWNNLKKELEAHNSKAVDEVIAFFKNNIVCPQCLSLDGKKCSCWTLERK